MCRLCYFAETCAEKLEKIRVIGVRRFMPNEKSIRLIMRQEVSSIKVLFMNNQSIYYDGLDAWSQLGDLKRGISRQIGIIDDLYFTIVFRDPKTEIEVILLVKFL